MAAMKKREKHLAAGRLPTEAEPGLTVISPISCDPLLASLLALLEMIKDMDRFGTPQKGPKPKRDTLIAITQILQRNKLPIATGTGAIHVRTVCAELARIEGINLSEIHVRDLLHQLQDLAERLFIRRFIRSGGLRRCRPKRCSRKRLWVQRIWIEKHQAIRSRRAARRFREKGAARNSRLVRGLKGNGVVRNNYFRST